MHLNRLFGMATIFRNFLDKRSQREHQKNSIKVEALHSFDVNI
jgi:hypothetical protein